MERTARCSICGQPAGGALSLRETSRESSLSRPQFRDIAAHELCGGCMRWLGDLFARVARGETPFGALGLPSHHGGPGAAEGSCDFCSAALGGRNLTVEIVPARPASWLVHEARNRLILCYRLCTMCVAWCRSIVQDPSAVTGVAQRGLEGPPGQWFPAPRTNARTLGLLPNDRFVAQQAIEASGGAFLAGEAASSAASLVLLAAGRQGRAARYVAMVPPQDRARIAVVARMDTIADGFDALRHGAGELLASPLSPQQVAAAAERLLQAPPSPRDPATGLPLLSGEPPAYHYRGQCLRIVPQDPSKLPETALLLRRFLRGYDRIATDGQGALVAVVYCPAEHLAAVARRLAPLLEGASITASNRGAGQVPKAA